MKVFFNRYRQNKSEFTFIFLKEIKYIAILLENNHNIWYNRNRNFKMGENLDFK